MFPPRCTGCMFFFFEENKKGRVWEKSIFVFIIIDKPRAKGNTYICESGCRCNERLKAKTEGSKLLAYTGLRGGRGHLKIKTRLRGEMFESVRGECSN
jgi:hypothetical protein